MQNETNNPEMVYIFKCPQHGIFENNQKFNFKDVDESKTSNCSISGCTETAVYAGFQPKV
jgi:hypothetical protein